MSPQIDFDIADSILRVLEGWELGNKDLYKKYWAYKKSGHTGRACRQPATSLRRNGFSVLRISGKLVLEAGNRLVGSRPGRACRQPATSLRRNGFSVLRISGKLVLEAGNLGISSETTIPGISSETAAPSCRP